MKRYQIILGIGLLFAIFFWHCAREKPEPMPTGMVEELALLPESPTGLGYFSLEAFRQSPVYTIIRDSLKQAGCEDRDYQEFVEMTGLDVIRDVNEIYFMVIADTIKEKPAFLITVNGTFDSEKIVNFILKKDEDRELVKEEFQGITLFTLKEERFAFCFPSSDRLVWGDIQLIKSYLEKLNSSPHPGQPGPVVEEMIKPLQYKSGGWLVVNVPPIFKAVTEKMGHHREAPKLNGFKSLQQINLSAKIEQNLRFSGVSRFDDAQKAKLFFDAIKGFISSLKLAASDDRQTVDVLSKIKVRQRNQEVQVHFQLTIDDIKRLMKKKMELGYLD